MHARPQDRRLHSRGAVYEAHFEPAGQIDDLTVATHLSTPTRVVVRFSNGGTAAADDREKGVRGMAVKFLVDDRQVADMVAASSPRFPARTPEAFVALIELLATMQGGLLGKLKAAPKLVSLLTKHPETRRTILAKPAAPPASYATCAFYGIHAFLLVDSEGRRQPFRYQLTPELGEVALDSEQARTLAPDFLAGELDDRLAQGPVVFALTFQLAQPGDPTDDPTVDWPAERENVIAGQIVLTGRCADEAKWQSQVFDPTRVPDGVELSGDPILAFRTLAYAESAHRRHTHAAAPEPA